MARTCLENLEKRRWASKYWRELPAEAELEQLIQHELTRDVEVRCLRRTLSNADAEAIAREIIGQRQLLIIRERERLAFAKAYPLAVRWLRAA